MKTMVNWKRPKKKNGETRKPGAQKHNHLFEEE